MKMLPNNNSNNQQNQLRIIKATGRQSKRDGTFENAYSQIAPTINQIRKTIEGNVTESIDGLYETIYSHFSDCLNAVRQSTRITFRTEQMASAEWALLDNRMQAIINA